MANIQSVQPKITLHWLEVSRAHRILWLLEELNIQYELKTWKRTNGKLADPKLKEIHPLGKSPIVTIEVPGQEPVVLIESANIIEYLCGYYGKHLIPKQYKDGREGQIGGESEGWLRYRTFMHYGEGGIMPLMVMSLLVQGIKDASVPFFVKPVTNGVASKVYEDYLTPNFKLHYTWIESQLATTPDGGSYLCGKDFSAADVLMSFPLEAGQTRSGMTQKECPKMWEYVDLLHSRPAYKKSVEKIKQIEGSFKTNI